MSIRSGVEYFLRSSFVSVPCSQIAFELFTYMLIGYDLLACHWRESNSKYRVFRIKCLGDWFLWVIFLQLEDTNNYQNPSFSITFDKRK